MKDLLKEWNEYTSSLNEMSRLYTGDASDYKEDMLNKAAKSQRKSRLSLSFTKWVEAILTAVDSNRDEKLFVSFVDEIEKNGKNVVPPLGVSPKIKYNTPHGVYGYPLNNENVYSLLCTGAPTDAEFAVNRKYMHIYTVSSDDVITIGLDGTNYIDNKADRDIETMSLTFVNYVTSYLDKKADSVNERMKKNPSKPANYSQVKDYIGQLVYDRYVRQNRDLRAISREIAEAAKELSLTDFNGYVRLVRNSRFYQVYYVAWLYSTVIALLGKKKSGTYDHQNLEDSEGVIQSGGLFSILLSGIGIKGVDDSIGKGVIHNSEPQQAFITDTSFSSGDSTGYNLIGTYKSPWKWFGEKLKPYPIYIFELDHIINKLLEKGSIDIDSVFPAGHKKPDDHFYQEAIDTAKSDAKKEKAKETLRYKMQEMVKNDYKEIFKILKEVKNSFVTGGSQSAFSQLKNVIQQVDAMQDKTYNTFSPYATKLHGGQYDPTKYIYYIDLEFAEKERYYKETWWRLQDYFKFPTYGFGSKPADESVEKLKDDGMLVTPEIKNEYKEFCYLALEEVRKEIKGFGPEEWEEQLDKLFAHSFFQDIHESKKLNNNILKEYIKTMLM
jgi:hypothetical protein